MWHVSGWYGRCEQAIKLLWRIFVAGDRGRLLGMIEGIAWTEEWMADWGNKGDEGRVGLLLGRSVAGVDGWQTGETKVMKVE